MSTQQQIRNRLTSVHNILHITQAMEVVAGVQFRKVMNKMEQFQFYSKQLTQMMEKLTNAMEVSQFAICEVRKVERIGVIIIASDKGLCGSYNENLFRAAESFLKTLNPNPVELFLYGHKTLNHFKKGNWPIKKTVFDWARLLSYSNVKEWSKEYVTCFENAEFDELWVVYTHFLNIITKEIRIEQLLPLKQQKSQQESSNHSVLFEPEPEKIYENILPTFFFTKIQATLLDAQASELASRIISMKAATKNAEEMIEELTLIKNKNRQYSITKEILEITAGAEGLK